MCPLVFGGIMQQCRNRLILVATMFDDKSGDGDQM